MPHITVDDEQARIIHESAGEIEVRDSTGRRIGVVAVDQVDPAMIAVAKKRVASDGPWCTTPEVLDHLRRSGDA